MDIIINPDRALVFHMRCEHRAIREALRGLEAEFSALAATPGGRAHLTHGLVELRDRLERHFEEEEQGGCMEEAACRCPNLTAEVRRLEEEHPLLLMDLGLMIHRLRHATEETADELKARFDRFARRLRAHEACEDRVLEKGLNTNMEMELEDI